MSGEAERPGDAVVALIKDAVLSTGEWDQAAILAFGTHCYEHGVLDANGADWEARYYADLLAKDQRAEAAEAKLAAILEWARGFAVRLDNFPPHDERWYREGFAAAQRDALRLISEPA